MAYDAEAQIDCAVDFGTEAQSGSPAVSGDEALIEGARDFGTEAPSGGAVAPRYGPLS